METTDQIWVYTNKHYTEDEEITGALTEFIINGLRWQLNYRGDAPLVIFHTNGDKHILQIDGDLFFPVDADLADMENEEEIYDGYLFPIEEALKMLNILLYEDLELVLDPELEEREIYFPYDLEYNGKNGHAFKKLLEKVKKDKVIDEKDLKSLL